MRKSNDEENSEDEEKPEEPAAFIGPSPVIDGSFSKEIQSLFIIKSAKND